MWNPLTWSLLLACWPSGWVSQREQALICRSEEGDQKARGSIQGVVSTESMWTRGNPCWLCQQASEGWGGCSLLLTVQPLLPSPAISLSLPPSPALSFLTGLAVQWAWRVVSWKAWLWRRGTGTLPRGLHHSMQHQGALSRMPLCRPETVLFCELQCSSLCIQSFLLLQKWNGSKQKTRTVHPSMFSLTLFITL